jgi:predicted RNA-binding protein with RPS1 domain
MTPKQPSTQETDPSSLLLLLTALQRGDYVSGHVVKLLPYGVLIQTADGSPSSSNSRNKRGVALLHQSNIPAGVDLRKGSLVEQARVIKVNHQEGTVQLSLKPPSVDGSPRIAVGQELDARVVKIVPYGAFLEVANQDRHVLLHVSRMSIYKVKEIQDHVQIGQSVPVRVIQRKGRDVAVSMLSKENDDFVDRKELQSKRMALWRQVVRHGAENDSGEIGDDEESTRKAKQELLDIDRQLWGLMSEYMDTPRTLEV